MANTRKYSNLLSPLVLPNGVVLKNRMTAAASTNNLIQGNSAAWPREAMITMFSNRAKNGASMITVTGLTEKGSEFFYRNIARDPKFTLFDLSNPTTQVLFAQLGECVHMYDSKMILQLIPKSTPDYDVSDGASPMNFIMNGPKVPPAKELTKEMLDEIKASQIEWAKYAQNAGFDGVLVHMCYRFSTAARMLSKRTNQRTDEYGGSFENRCRWPLEICKGIKEACGNKFIVQAVISGNDPEPDGWTSEDTVAFAKLAEGCVDMLQIRNPEIDPHHPTSYQKERYPNLKDAADITAGIKAAGICMAVETLGGYNDPDVMEEILEKGQADLIGSARIWISNPEYGKLIDEGRKEDIVPCVRCNKCHHRASHVTPQITCCSVNPKWGLEHRIDSMFDEPKCKKNTAVIGGGPAGMKAALVLAERGHNVTLYEKTDRLGGLLNTTDGVSFKWSVNDYKNWLVDRVCKTPEIQVVLNTEVTPEMLKQANYDAVLVGIGSTPITPKIPGIENARDAVSVFGNEESVGQDVVIIGGGEVGVDVGMHLAEMGRNVTVIEMTGMLCATSNIMHTYSHIKKYWESLPTFHYALNAAVSNVTENSVKYMDKDGVEHEINCSTVLYAVGLKPKSEEALKLFDTQAYNAYLIGDCGSNGGDIQRCNRSALGAASMV